MLCKYHCFLAHLVKGNVSFCHHLASVVLRLSSVNFSHFNLLLWCLLMDQNEMSNLYRGPSIDASYQVSYHLAKWFQMKSCFRNRTIRNKNCLRRPCLLTDQNGMSNSHRGPSIDSSYQVSVHLTERFQRRRFLKIGQSETWIACGGHVWAEWKVSDTGSAQYGASSFLFKLQCFILGHFAHLENNTCVVIHHALKRLSDRMDNLKGRD
jgi:hypothetical protein